MAKKDSPRSAADPARGRLSTPTDLGGNAVKDIAAAMNVLLADTFALFFKTKNFHWHVSGPHFRDYHLLLDDQSAEILATTDDMAERVRKLGGQTLKSPDQVVKMSRIAPNEADYVEPADMLAELMEDNRAQVAALRAAHDICDEHGDVATASLIENWIDAAEKRIWFLYETLRPAQSGGH
ncbi:Dps family protein [Pseudogemmobacter humi]|uniref:DNA protection during starvation protein 1 n=1 Tax=Pseudogemmobacter humi TaxID=2483812 RepID=A0A3P5X3D5_9RHOB|nr:DNA starvation/stationary phase protection protein [Pseudogemmobacter humi]VDC28584.1 DNA protection during starvation protein 1 [Pseudogemmobacter humi]